MILTAEYTMLKMFLPDKIMLYIRCEEQEQTCDLISSNKDIIDYIRITSYKITQTPEHLDKSAISKEWDNSNANAPYDANR